MMESEPLDQYEMEQLWSLLRRFCAAELDQWEAWSTETPDGPAFITISRATPLMTLEEDYVSIDPEARA